MMDGIVMMLELYVEYWGSISKLILAIYTWTCMHTITKSQLYTAETLVLVRAIYLEESDASGAMNN